MDSRRSPFVERALVDRHRRLVVQSLVRPTFPVIVEPAPDALLGFCPIFVRLQVHLLVFERPPKPLHEDVVHAAPLPIHADLHAVSLEHIGEVGSGELGSLVAVEDGRSSVSVKRLLQRLDAKPYVESVRQPPGEHIPGIPIHDDDQVEESPLTSTPRSKYGYFSCSGWGLLVLGPGANPSRPIFRITRCTRLRLTSSPCSLKARVIRREPRKGLFKYSSSIRRISA